MSRLLIILFGSLGIWPAGPAQDLPAGHTTSRAPDSARYEIVQSTMAAKWTFRLDRFSGRVDLLVRTQNDQNAWEMMEQIEPPIAPPVKPRFQLFLSGIAARFHFLLDTESGKTWRLATETRKDTDGSTREIQVWEPFVK